MREYPLILLFFCVDQAVFTQLNIPGSIRTHTDETKLNPHVPTCKQWMSYFAEIKKRAIFLTFYCVQIWHDWFEFAVVRICLIWFENIQLIESKWPAKNAATVPFFWNEFANQIILARKSCWLRKKIIKSNSEIFGWIPLLFHHLPF